LGAEAPAQRRPRRWCRPAGRLLVAAGAFALAFVADLATGNRWTPVWGSLAIVASLLALVPRLRIPAALVGAHAGCWVGFNLLRAVADDAGLGLGPAEAVPRLEARVFGGDLPSASLQRAFYDPGVTRWYDAALILVYLSFFVVPHAVAAALLVRDRSRFGRYLGATAVLVALGLVGFFLLPTNPLWLTGAATGADGGPVDRIVPAVLGGGGADAGYSFEPNPVASMPSVHVAVTALLVFLAWRSGRLWRALAAVYAGLMAFALVYLGEHYVLDVVAGLVVAAVGWRMAGVAARRVAAAGVGRRPQPERVRAARGGMTPARPASPPAPRRLGRGAHRPEGAGE